MIYKSGSINLRGYVTSISPAYRASGFILVNTMRDITGQSALALSFDLKNSTFTNSVLPVITTSQETLWSTAAT